MVTEAERSAEAEALKNRADEAREAGRHADADGLYKQALAVAAGGGDKVLMARILAGIGHGLADRKEHRLAIEAYQDGLNLLDPTDNAREIAVLNFNLGSVCLDYSGEDRWTFVMMASDVLRRAREFFTEKDWPDQYKATSELLLRADGEIARSPMAQAEVVLDD